MARPREEAQPCRAGGREASTSALSKADRLPMPIALRDSWLTATQSGREHRPCHRACASWQMPEITAFSSSYCEPRLGAARRKYARHAGKNFRSRPGFTVAAAFAPRLGDAVGAVHALRALGRALS